MTGGTGSRATASDVAGFRWRPANASQPRLAAVRQAAGYWSCFDCSPSLDSGAFFGTPATVSVSCSPGFGACSSTSSGRSCVDSLTAISLVAVAGGYPAGAAATLLPQHEPRAPSAFRPLSQWTAMKEGLLGGTLDVSP